MAKRKSREEESLVGNVESSAGNTKGKFVSNKKSHSSHNDDSNSGSLDDRNGREQGSEGSEDGNSESYDDDEEEYEESSDEDDSDSGSDFSKLDVDFEFFDPQPTDYFNIKQLLRQLLGPRSEDFDLAGLTDLVLNQPTVGTTVKTDGNESDPYLILTALSLREHAQHKSIKDILNLIKGNAGNSGLVKELSSLLQNSKVHIGLILSSRVANIADEIAGPSYQMLIEELGWAVEDSEPYDFTHYLIISRSFKAENVENEEEEEEEEKSKDTNTANNKNHSNNKNKNDAQKYVDSGKQYYYAEDPIFEINALKQASFLSDIQTKERRKRDHTNAITSLEVFLMSKDGFIKSVETMQDYFK